MAALEALEHKHKHARASMQQVVREEACASATVAVACRHAEAQLVRAAQSGGSERVALRSGAPKCTPHALRAPHRDACLFFRSSAQSDVERAGRPAESFDLQAWQRGSLRGRHHCELSCVHSRAVRSHPLVPPRQQCGRADRRPTAADADASPHCAALLSTPCIIHAVMVQRW